jgi:hypothetical protein
MVCGQGDERDNNLTDGRENKIEANHRQRYLHFNNI